MNSRFKGSEAEGIVGCPRPWLACSPQHRHGGRWAAETGSQDVCTGSQYVCTGRPCRRSTPAAGTRPPCPPATLAGAVPLSSLAADLFQLVHRCGLSGFRPTRTVSSVLPMHTALSSHPALYCLLSPLVTQSAMQSDIREPDSVTKVL